MDVSFCMKSYDPPFNEERMPQRSEVFCKRQYKCTLSPELKNLWCTRVSSRFFLLKDLFALTRPPSDTMRTSRAAWSDAERDRMNHHSWIPPRTLILCAFRFILLFIRYATNLPCARDFFLTNMLGKQKKRRSDRGARHGFSCLDTPSKLIRVCSFFLVFSSLVCCSLPHFE
jgi:hypothetical protein